MSLSATLAALVGLATRRAWLSVLLGLIITGLALTATITRLGVTTDTDLLFAETLPWRQRDMAFNKAFPQFQDLLVAVVDGASRLLAEIFGAAGRHARSAVGVAALPRDVPVEVEFVAAISG
jgi:hypothetical protein